MWNNQGAYLQCRPFWVLRYAQFYQVTFMVQKYHSLHALWSLSRKSEFCTFAHDLRVVLVRGLFPVTSPCNKSWGQVLVCELAIFASNSSRRDQVWSLRLVPQIQTSLNLWDKPLRLFPPNASCELFERLVSSWVPTFIPSLQSVGCIYVIHSPCFIPASLFYTQSIMFSLCFIP